MKTQSSLKRMSEENLDAYAAESLGMVFESDVSKEQKVTEILAAQGVPEEPERPEAIQTPPDDEERLRFMLHPSDGPGGDLPVAVGVNGYVVTIPRGTEVRLQKRYVNALRRAMKTIYEEKRDSEGNSYRAPREVPRFSFQVLE